VLHCHDADAKPDNIHLTQHLEAYHPSQNAAECDWHLHVMLMGDLVASGSDEDEGERPTEPPLVCTSAASLANLSLTLQSNVEPVFAGVASDLSSQNGSLLSRYSNLSGNNFSTSLLSARPLCAVLGIARC
jgi:hypothetical protein